MFFLGLGLRLGLGLGLKKNSDITNHKCFHTIITNQHICKIKSTYIYDSFLNITEFNTLLYICFVIN